MTTADVATSAVASNQEYDYFRQSSASSNREDESTGPVIGNYEAQS